MTSSWEGVGAALAFKTSKAAGEIIWREERGGRGDSQ